MAQISADLKRTLTSSFFYKNEHVAIVDGKDAWLGDAPLSWGRCSNFLSLPGLRGFWPMSSFDEGGNAYDLSGQGRTLTYNGNPTYNYVGLAPYIDLDGTGDFLSRADEAGLDISGTESYVAAAAQGLTMGGWFYFNNLDPNRSLINKWDAATNQRAYLFQTNTDWRFAVSNNGVASKWLMTGVTPAAATWYFSVARFIPSTEVAIFVNMTKYADVTAIPASLFNSNVGLGVGGSAAGGGLWPGRISFCFLCATALSDTMIGALFQQTRNLFGV